MPDMGKLAGGCRQVRNYYIRQIGLSAKTFDHPRPPYLDRLRLPARRTAPGPGTEFRNFERSEAGSHKQYAATPYVTRGMVRIELAVARSILQGCCHT